MPFLLMLRLATSWHQLLIRCSSKNKYNVFTYNLTLFMETVLILNSPIWTCWLLWSDCSTMTQKLINQAMLVTWNQNAITKCSCEHLLLKLVAQTNIDEESPSYLTNLNGITPSMPENGFGRNLILTFSPSISLLFFSVFASSQA